jgi:hypothetical protein
MEHLTTNYFWNEHKYKFKHVTQHSPDISWTKQTYLIGNRKENVLLVDDKAGICPTKEMPYTKRNDVALFLKDV